MMIDGIILYGYIRYILYCDGYVCMVLYVDLIAHCIKIVCVWIINKTNEYTKKMSFLSIRKKNPRQTGQIAEYTIKSINT